MAAKMAAKLRIISYRRERLHVVVDIFHSCWMRPGHVLPFEFSWQCSAKVRR
jgi:hypothetical protein